MKSPRTAAENKYTNVGKSRAEKLDAFADPKRQMTEDNNNNKKRSKNKKKEIEKQKGQHSHWGYTVIQGRGRGVAGAFTRVYFNANICLFLNGVGFIFSILSLSLFWVRFL